MASSAIVLRPQHGIEPAELAHGLCCDEDIEIYLTTAGSNPSVIPLKVCTGDTIASVKMRIQACKGFYVKHQKLVYGGRELHRQDALVKDYGLTDGKRVHLVVKLSELQIVTIKTFSGKEHVFRIDKMKSVRDLKKRLSKKSGFAAEKQQLVLRGQDLKDEMLIEQLALADDAVVHLFLRSTVRIRSQAIGSDVELSATVPESKPMKPEIQVPELLTANNCYEKPLLPPSEVKAEVEHIKQERAYIEGLSTFKISSVLVDLMQKVKAGLEQGNAPILSPEGSGGAYFMQDEFGSGIVGVFKPIDEEPMAVNNPRGLPLSSTGEGLKRGTKVGEGALREVAAYILDHVPSGQEGDKLTGFAGVPPTVLIKCSYQSLTNSKTDRYSYPDVKIGSLQMFVHASSSCEDMGPAQFPVHEVHKIAVLDIRLANTDRNGANILACKSSDSSPWTLVPIDHGYCLPDKFEDCTFEWLYWPQSKLPFESETLKYIANLDAEADITLLEKHGWTLSSSCARVLRVGTMLLKKGAAAGLTPYDIGSMMCRQTLNRVSLIEEILEDAEGNVLPGSSEAVFIKEVSSVMDKYIQARVGNFSR